MMEQRPSAEQLAEHFMLGSYSSHRHIHTGMGATAHVQEQGILWLAVLLPTADICIQPLDPSCLPTGLVSAVSRSDFFQHYLPEPDCYDQHIRPKAKKLSEWLGAMGAPMPQKQTDKDNGLLLRAFLAVLHGMSGSTMREAETDTLRALVRQAAELPLLEHFQISISAAAVRQRKERNYPLAIDFYSRALKVGENDHLLFNIARTHYEMKNIAAATECLTKALALNPELAVARQFLDFLSAPATT